MPAPIAAAAAQVAVSPQGRKAIGGAVIAALLALLLLMSMFGAASGDHANAAPPGQCDGEPAGAGGPTTYNLGNVQPQTAQVAQKVGPMFNIKTVGGYRPPPTSGPNYDPNGHPAGLALDFMINDLADGKATGDKVAGYLQQHAVELRVRYIIWNQRIWEAAKADKGWVPMGDRGSDTENHRDHVHVSLTSASTTTQNAGTQQGGPAPKTLDAAWTDGMPAQVGPWGKTQIANAAQIIKAGQSLHLDPAVISIGVMTAMGESSLTVLDRGDKVGPDSRGLFQQRANGAWGSYSDRMNPFISSTNYFKAMMKVDGYQTLPPTIVAHRTQQNADANYYAPFWGDAVKVVAALTKDPDLISKLPASGGAPDQCGQGPVAASPGWGSPFAAGVKYTKTSPFGWRSNPAHGGAWLKHYGQDMAVPQGTPIYAVCTGVVVQQVNAVLWGGQQTWINCGGSPAVMVGTMHMSGFKVQVGQHVNQGEQIGLSGGTPGTEGAGGSTGAHLHLQIQTGTPGDAGVGTAVDPIPFLAQKGVKL